MDLKLLPSLLYPLRVMSRVDYLMTLALETLKLKLNLDLKKRLNQKSIGSRSPTTHYGPATNPA